MPLTDTQQAKIDEKEAMMADSLKRAADVDYYEGWFFVTTITREMCMVMNELARVISGQRDDWWKNSNEQYNV